jgi:hypothetical protein
MYKILYPIIIIIFSILFIYAILKNKENKNFNDKVEKFLNKKWDNLRNSALSNVSFTTDFLNGSWTTLNTKVDSGYNVNNVMEININKSIKDNLNDNNYGTITIDSTTYNIILVSNENIIGSIVNSQNNIANSAASLHIKIINTYNTNDNAYEKNLIYTNNTNQKCIVSQYTGDTLLYRYISYKIYNNKVGSELYRIILAGDYYIAKDPPMYDYNVYNKLINNYNYPNNYIKIDNYDVSSNSELSKTTLNNLKNKYNNVMKFYIQRVFYSPAHRGGEIITKLSSPIELEMSRSGNLPSKLTVVPFKNDKIANNLENFFRPKSTILYCTSLDSTNEKFDYSNKNKISIPNSFLKLSDKNNSTNMFSENGISIDNILFVEKIIVNNTSLYRVNIKESDLNNPTFFNFSDLYPVINT